VHFYTALCIFFIITTYCVNSEELNPVYFDDKCVGHACDFVDNTVPDQ